jgi:hypothetical protein
MKCNVGKRDKIIRLVLGLLIISIGIYFKTWWGIVGAILIITALIGWCPAYVPFGISTCAEEKKEVST